MLLHSFVLKTGASYFRNKVPKWLSTKSQLCDNLCLIVFIFINLAFEWGGGGRNYKLIWINSTVLNLLTIKMWNCICIKNWILKLVVSNLIEWIKNVFTIMRYSIMRLKEKRNYFLVYFAFYYKKKLVCPFTIFCDKFVYENVKNTMFVFEKFLQKAAITFHFLYFSFYYSFLFFVFERILN